MKNFKKRKLKNEKGAAMLLALFTVVILAAVGTAFFAITMTESNTTDARIDSELALEMANAGLDYVATVASVQSNSSVEGGTFWVWDPSLSKCRPNFDNDRIFKQLPDGSYQMIFNMEDPLSPKTESQLLLAREQYHTGKIVGCVVLFPDPADPAVSEKFPDILATSVGFVVDGDDPDAYVLANLDTTDVHATRAVQAVLKEVSFYNYVYIYQNFTDLDLSFNVPDDYKEFMKNMVGLTPDTVVDGGVRADGTKDADGNYDQDTSDRVGRLLIWDENGLPVTSNDPDDMATINGPVSLVSSDEYDGTGTWVVDAGVPGGGYNLTANMLNAFQGYSKNLGAEQRGVPGANEYFMGSIQTASGFGANPNTTSVDPVAGTIPGNINALSINNSQIFMDGADPANLGEDLDTDEQPDYSKNICRLTFSVNASGEPEVTVNIYNRYAGLTSEEGTSGADGDINTILGTPACLVESSGPHTMDQDTVIYVNGGNVMVEGEIGSGVTVVCDDSRTPPSDVDSTLDDLLSDNAPAGYTEEEWDFFRKLEKSDPQGAPASEGNIFITGDITHEDEKLAAMGIISENYLYLHDIDSDPAELNVRAQLNSIRQSLQFDFFNYLREDPTGTGDPDNFFLTGAGAPNFNGTFNFEGQMVGKMTDVEGDIDGRGYSNINISYDDILRYYSAPYFYNEDYSDIPTGTLQFAITGYFDMSSLSTTTSP